MREWQSGQMRKLQETHWNSLSLSGFAGSNVIAESPASRSFTFVFDSLCRVAFPLADYICRTFWRTLI